MKESGGTMGGGAKSAAKRATMASKKSGKPALTGKLRGRRWPRDPRNVYRPGSAYGVCFDILAAHKSGLPRVKVVELLAKATGKDIRHAGYDAHIVLTPKGNESGLDRNDGPRHRSARPGYWVQRTNGHVRLMVD